MGRHALLFAATMVLGCASATEGIYGDRDSGGLGGGDGVPDGGNGYTGTDDLASPMPTPDLSSLALCIVPMIGEWCPTPIFVSTTGDDSLTGRTPSSAVKHVNIGIIRALTCGPPSCVVVIAGGDYNEQVILHEGVSLYGGYASDFLSRDPASHTVTLTTQEDRTVVADGLVLATRLDGLTIQGPTLTTPDGRSSYGLWVSNSHQALTVSGTIVKAGHGAPGVPGNPGTDRSCGAVGASGGTAYDCGGSTGGFGTAAGDPVAGGVAGTGGSSNCPSSCPLVGSDGISDGDDGQPGTSGTHGPGGAPANDTFGNFVDGKWKGAIGNPGERGLNGTGGGGGGSGGTKRIRVCFGCGTLIGGRGGDGAPGGCGGGGGDPGGPGGGAFAVLLNSSDLILDTVTVSGGTGGAGGVGGDGRGGQDGSTGVDNGREGSSSSKCGLINYHSGNGGHGGVGGKGGAGGGGSGGVGGASVALVRLGSSLINKIGTVQITAGTAGSGGSGGRGSGNAGLDGTAGAVAAERAY